MGDPGAPTGPTMECPHHAVRRSWAYSSHVGPGNATRRPKPQTSGEVDRIYSLESLTREAALAAAEAEARAQAAASGALEESIVVTEREDVPLAYLRGNATRVRVKVVGDLQF